jgi:hypothetical protein
MLDVNNSDWIFAVCNQMRINQLLLTSEQLLPDSNWQLVWLTACLLWLIPISILNWFGLAEGSHQDCERRVIIASIYTLRRNDDNNNTNPDLPQGVNERTEASTRTAHTTAHALIQKEATHSISTPAVPIIFHPHGGSLPQKPPSKVTVHSRSTSFFSRARLMREREALSLALTSLWNWEAWVWSTNQTLCVCLWIVATMRAAHWLWRRRYLFLFYIIKSYFMWLTPTSWENWLALLVECALCSPCVPRPQSLLTADRA